MAFTQTVELTKYVQGAAPTLPATKDIYVEMELRKIALALDSVHRAIEEIRTHLTTP